MKRSSIRHCFLVAVLVSTIALVLFGFIIIKLSEMGIFNDTSTTSASSGQNEAQKIETVTDNPPDLELIGDSLVKVDDINNYVEPGFSAEDDFDGNLTDSVQTELSQLNNYNYQIKYSVKDSAGNTTTKTRDIRVIIGIVCLTFDDGPSREITPQILDTLDAKGVNATFFITGFGEDKKDLVKREDKEGNVVALHGYSHEYSQIYNDINTLMTNFYKLEDLVKETIGKDSKIIRFPGGASNTVSKNYCPGIMTCAVQRVTDEGYIYVDWNVDSNDAGADAQSSEAIYTNVVQGLKPGRTNVVLMHDRAEKQATADALPNIIDYCLDNGYDIQVITPETSVKSSQHHPNN